MAGRGVVYMMPNISKHHTQGEFTVISPSAAPSSTAKTEDFGEHCLSSATSRVLCGLLGRVTQPPGLASSAGKCEAPRQ
jgi:hypothetical protein